MNSLVFVPILVGLAAILGLLARNRIVNSGKPLPALLTRIPAPYLRLGVGLSAVSIPICAFMYRVAFGPWLGKPTNDGIYWGIGFWVSLVLMLTLIVWLRLLAANARQFANP